MACSRTTPFNPSMKGMLMSNQSPSSRLTEPLRPNSSCIATAPAKGGMMSGMTPSVWIRIAPLNWKREVM